MFPPDSHLSFLQMNYNLPPQNLGNLIDLEKRVEFVRARGIAEKPKILDSDDIPESGWTSGCTYRHLYPFSASTHRSFIPLYENLPEESNNSKKEPKIEDSDDEVIVLDEIEIKREPGTQKIDIRDVNGYLKAAKDGNLEELRRFLKKKIPIDVTDFYGWTATMCAAGDGNFEICKYLLENGADPGVRDKNGMGILQIAQKNRKETFVRLLMDYFCNGSAPSTSSEPEKLTYCELCDTFVDEQKIIDHISSITHQLNDKSKPGVASQSGIHLGPSNIGYRLMCASGWTEQQGLGRNSDGHRFPIKTILKRNRTGLGMENLPKKVTHFGPLDRNSVRNEKKQRPVTKKDLERKKRKEDRITKKFRADFGDNDSVYEYFNADK